MMLDIDAFKAKRPWLQPGFWISLAPIVLVLLPTDARDWALAHWQAVTGASTAFMVWLAAQGLVRYGGVRAAGEAAAAIGPEIARYETIYGGDDAESNPPAGAELAGEAQAVPLEALDADQ